MNESSPTAPAAARSPSGLSNLRGFLLSSAGGALLWFLVSFVLFLCNWRVIRGWDCIPNERLPVVLLDHGNLDFRGSVQPWEKHNWYFVEMGDGRVNSFYPILPGLMNLPVHLLARAVGKDVHYRTAELGKVTAALTVSGSAAFLFLMGGDVRLRFLHRSMERGIPRLVAARPLLVLSHRSHLASLDAK